MTRAGLIDAFLAAAGWGGAKRSALAGDASARRYLRLHLAGGATAILMDAPPEICGSQEPFVQITAHLRQRGLAAPEILAADVGGGLLLLEDFGDGLVARLAEDPGRAEALYGAAVDVLAHVHGGDCPPGMSPVSVDRLVAMISPLFEHYAPGLTGQERSMAQETLRHRLSIMPGLAPSLALRDYHAENLIWRPAQTGLARVGLLDYQDAVVTHPAYDLVSLLRDARRDVPAALEAAMVARFLSATGLPRDAFLQGYALIGLQRNLRILGIFCRLAQEHGKPRYLGLLPRVWGHVRRTLDDGAFADLREAFAALPAPEAR